ncbi:MAG: hypothetical protein Kow0097_00140 [Candidatus Bipolaricaulota bacterium]
MCRLLGVLAREAGPLRTYLVDAPHGLHAMSLRGANAPHRDGVGWAYRDDRGRMRVQRWGRRALTGHADLPGDLAPRTTLLLAHARKASPEYAALVGALYAQPLVQDGIFLAHNGTIRTAVGTGGGTDSQRLLGWLVEAWQPRDVVRLAEALRSLLRLVRDYTALNLLLSDGRSLAALRQYATDPEYYTLWWRADADAVTVASERTDGRPGWQALRNGELLWVEPGLEVSRLLVAP